MNSRDAGLTVKSVILGEFARTADKTGLRASPEADALIQAIMDALMERPIIIADWLELDLTTLEGPGC